MNCKSQTPCSACRIFVHPDHVVSRTDGDEHYIPAGRLAELYGVRLRDCIIVDKHHPQNEHGYEKREGDIHLYPRRDGDYRQVPNAEVNWTTRATANSGTVHRLVLHLVLTGRWYDMMAGGVKDVEYRAMTEHWTRLIWNRRDRITHARFARGYTKETILRPVRCIDIGPCPYDGWDGEYYRIHMPPFEVENAANEPSSE